MFDYVKNFERFCLDNEPDLALSFDMPAGYETANGSFDMESKTVFINTELLKDAPDHEKAYYFFHELRHAMQYLHPELFSSAVTRSCRYVIMYNGICYKIISGRSYKCELEGGEDRFSDIYLGQPNEADANTYAYERVKEMFGDSEDLRRLYGFWVPAVPVPDETYDRIYAAIDEKVRETCRQAGPSRCK